jgi:ATPase subunit of ABC transporter with duplicated ATPase domains
MKKRFLRFRHVSFGYETATEFLFDDIDLSFAAGWSGVIGANGTGKTTLLMLATGLLEPNEGIIDHHLHALYCSQRTDDAPDRLDEFIGAETRSAAIVKNQLGIESDWMNRWSTLSHGERKRTQLAVALWLRPDVLAIDEPTNHMDAEAKEIIANALKAFEGIGLLVSHDRALLDTLCQQCVYIDPPDVIVRTGGYTRSMEALRTEQQYHLKQYLLKKRTYKKLKREATRRRELADKSRVRRSKRGLAKKDHDAREKIDRARVTGKDAVAGKLHRQIKGRLSRAREDLDGAKVKKEHALGIWLPGNVSRRKYLLELSEGAVSLGKRKELINPTLVIHPDDRIALTGPNGSGKSTLIRKIIGRLNAPKDRVTYIPQEIDAHRSGSILNSARGLPREKLGYLMTIISRLGSRPERLLDSDEPSPGEIRKLLLAVGMTAEPHIIVMDEPTNHMDLPSIECLEQALSDYPCALLLVSHDQRFLDNLTHVNWKIMRDVDSLDNYQLFVI